MGAFEDAEAALDYTQVLVCTGGIFRCECVIIGLDDPLAISSGGLLDGFLVQTNLSLCGDSKITLGTQGGQQVNGQLRPLVSISLS